MENSEDNKELRTLTDEQLEKILNDHQKWLQLSDYGKIHHKLGSAHKNFKADLSYCNFKSSDKLRDVELIQADLTGTDFQDAKLHRTAFKSANLAGVNFSGSDLTGALFTEDPFESRLATIEEASRISRKLFAWLLGLMGFSLLTIFSTRDVQLILNKSTSPLPIIQTPIPLASFYWVTPFIIFALYLYFNMHQTHVWRLISHLPARFPDGTPLDQKIFPWLINIWSNNFFIRLQSDRGKAFPMAKIQNGLVVFLIWWAGPLVLFIFWGRYLPRHDYWSYIQGFLLFLSIFTGGYYYHLAKKLLGRETDQDKEGKEIIKYGDWKNYFKPNWLFFLFSSLAKKLLRRKTDQDKEGKEITKYGNWKNYFKHNWLFFLCPTLLVLILTCGITWFSISENLNLLPEKIKSVFTANLINQELSKKPSDWNSDLEEIDPNLDEKTKNDLIKKYKKQLNRVKGAELAGINLRYSRARNAFLVKANLEEADLQEANLFSANLQEAKLSWANLQEAVLMNANLQKARLSRANLQEADLIDANLQKAVLIGANLREANLDRVDLGEANVKFSIFFNAKGFKAEQIVLAQNWNQALYDNKLRKQLGISDDQLRKTITGALKDSLLPMSESEKAVQLNKWNCLYELPDCQKSTSSNIKPSPVPQP